MLISRPSELIEVRRLPNRGAGGRGVFARRDIEAGTLLERAPVILVPRAEIFREWPGAQHSLPLAWYAFDWPLPPAGRVAVALGCGSMYNHSFRPNARYAPVEPDLLDFHATEPIPAGTEIFINYHGDGSQRPTT